VGTNIIKQSYNYDRVNRLLSAAETYNQAARWTQTYTFDQVGNRTALSNTGIDVLPTTSTPAVSSSTNRISATGYVYDNAGNLKDEPAVLNKHYKYDGENRLVDFNSGAVQYVYDGDDRRVKKIEAASPTRTTVFVYNPGGQLIAEYTSDPVPPPAGGGGTSYLTTDHLGSTRVVTGTNPTPPVKARYDYLPYGEEIPSTVGGRGNVGGYGGADSSRHKFTQKERDSESGLDYFLARYYSSAQGRFTSTDPVIVTPERFRDPQQFNLYAYTRNNPLRLVDPTGKILTISGDVDEAYRQLIYILGGEPDEAAQRISYNEKTNTITVDPSGIDLTKNEGAALLNDLVGSKNRYDLSVGSSVETIGGNISLILKIGETGVAETW